VKLEMYVIADQTVVDRITFDEEPAGVNGNPNPLYQTNVAETYVSWVLGRDDLSPFAKRRKLADTTCDDLPEANGGPDTTHAVHRVDDWTS
jgi:hypothetical protein